MDYISMENHNNGGDSGVGDENASSGWCTATPQRQRRPLQQLNYSNTASPKPNVSVTPYKYHKCRVIPEETENDENVDPCSKRIMSNTSHKIKLNASCVTNSDKDDSSPFAYPVIWEPHQIVTSSPSLTNQTEPMKTSCRIPSASPMEEPARPLAVIASLGNGENFESPPQDFCEGSANMEKNGCTENKENVREKETMKNTPSSSSSSHSKNSHSMSHPMVTPSKSTPTPPPSDRPIFLTPSERFKRTDCRGTMTPQRRKPTYLVNPFEVAAECLHLPAVSPSLFRQVVSPSQKVDTNFHWSIDQLAVLHPANIEPSAFNQVDIQHDPEYEQQAQEAIDRFFSHQSVVPSPWTGSQKSVNLLQMVCTPVNPVSSQNTPRTNTVWCQTELSLPPVLPEALEEALKPYMNFTQDQFWQGGCEDEGTSLNNTTLRRKLLFSHDELLNATPLCSPRGGDTPDPTSQPSSPSDSLPLHEDEEVHVTEEDEHKNLLWCGAIINPGDIGTSSKDPQLARCPPPTPPSNMVSISNHEPCDKYFGSRAQPGNRHDHSMHMCSPNLSPVQARQYYQEEEGSLTVASPDVSPIHFNHYIRSASPKDMFISASSPHSQDLSRKECVGLSNESKIKLSPSCTLPFYPTSYSDTVIHDQEMSPVSPRPNASPSSYFTMRLQQSLEFAVKCQDPGSNDRSCGSIHECVTETKLCTDTSHEDAVDRRKFPKEDGEDSLSTTPKTKKILSPCRIFRSLETQHKTAENNQAWDQKSEDTPQNLVPVHDDKHETDQQKTPVKPTGEQRSTSGHFSSSPIREDNSPLTMNTPTKRFSSSPPLSPILCRSLMFLPHQESQPQKPQLKSHLNLSQSTHMSIDLEGKSCTEEDIIMEEERIGLAPNARLSGQPPLHPRTITLRRSSSVCDMETDSNPSLEVNISGEIASHDTGYQTGSLHTTNFSMSTFGNDNGTSTTMAHLKDCHFSSIAKPTSDVPVDAYTSEHVCNIEGGTVWEANS